MELTPLAKWSPFSNSYQICCTHLSRIWCRVVRYRYFKQCIGFHNKHVAIKCFKSSDKNSSCSVRHLKIPAQFFRALLPVIWTRVRNLLGTVSTQHHQGITLGLPYPFRQKSILLHNSLCGLYLRTKLRYCNKCNKIKLQHCFVYKNRKCYRMAIF